MAVVGHWANLTEAQKLTQSVLLQGVVEEVVETGHLLPMLPVKMITGKSLIYNREKSWTPQDGADFFDIHQPIPWTADVEYAAQVEVALTRVARQDVIDNFVAKTYSNINDYRALLLRQIAKRLSRFVEDRLIYADATNNNTREFDGLHRLNVESAAAVAAASAAAGDVDIDMSEGALSLATLRLLLDNCKVDQLGKDNVFILAPREIARRFDAAYQEAGFVRSNVTVSLGQYNINGRDIGGRIMTFDGIPIIRSDFLVAEQLNTGLTTSSLRAKYSSGTKGYSVFVVRLGQTEDGGLSMLFGDPEGEVSEGEFKGFARTPFDKLEDYDAGGERLVSYLAPALGSTLSLGRITDITDAAIVP